eukprot:PhM_4_TR8895/c0_g1_i1/m.88147
MIELFLEPKSAIFLPKNVFCSIFFFLSFSLPLSLLLRNLSAMLCHRNGRPVGGHSVHVRLVLRREGEGARNRPQQHLREVHPILHVVARHERLQVIAPNKRRRTLVHALRQRLEKADGDVAVEEAQPLEQEPTRGLHPARVAAPVRQSVADVPLEHLHTLVRADIPVALVLDLVEDPWLDERAATNHHGLRLVVLHVVVVVNKAKNVSVANDRDVREISALCNVVPVGLLRVSLPTAAAVDRDALHTPRFDLGYPFVQRRLTLVLTDTDFDCGRAARGGEVRREAGHYVTNPTGVVQQRAAAALVVDKVNGAAAVEVNEVKVEIRFAQHFSDARGLHAVARGDLHTEETLRPAAALRVVLPKEAPLAALETKQVVRECHLTACDVGTVLLAHTAVRQVPHGC